MSSLKHTSIPKESFDDILSRYSATAPDKLQDLDTLRYETIPATLAERKKSGAAYLKKEEVEKLVEWKLKHGTFRPKLLQLVQSNPSSLIEDTTRKAFAIITPEQPLKALKVLTELKGIGPATASLLLSVCDPDEVPFFSDELFRWVMWDEEGGGGPSGWKRAIKYNNKEYGELVKRVKDGVERLQVSAVDCERVAWVLGKEGVDVVKSGEGVVNEDVEKASKGVKKLAKEERVVKGKRKGKEVAKEEKKGVKRKVEAMKPAVAEGVRRSSRRKMGS